MVSSTALFRPGFSRVRELLAPVRVGLDGSWGLDHGTWSVLCHVYPDATVPIVQLSIDRTKPASFHFELGRHLAQFRDEGVLVAGSGNLVHNLRAYTWGHPDTEPYDWAVRFESRAKDLILADNPLPLIEYEGLGDDALLSAPRPSIVCRCSMCSPRNGKGIPLLSPFRAVRGDPCRC